MTHIRSEELLYIVYAKYRKDIKSGPLSKASAIDVKMALWFYRNFSTIYEKRN